MLQPTPLQRTDVPNLRLRSARLPHPHKLPRLPRLQSRTSRGLRDLIAGLGVFALYLLVTHGLHPAKSVSDAHGQQLLRAENFLHLNPEHTLNNALPPHSLLALLASYEYAYVYVLTTFGVLGWLWVSRNPAYGWARNTLILVNLIAITVFALWPATPPRLLPGAGFMDIVAIHHPPGSWGSSAVSGANQYAAMPSLHIGWAVWVSVALIRARAHRGGNTFGALHLGVTILVILTTANHYVLDIFAGAAVVGLAALIEQARLGATRRWRPSSSQLPPVTPPDDAPRADAPVRARVAP
jgi:hypothetical protein